MNVDDHFWKTVLDNLYDGVYFVDHHGKISYWNKGAERITGCESKEMLGTTCWDNVLEHMNSRPAPPRHGFEDSEPGGTPLYRDEEVSILHREGHRVPVMTRTAVIRDFHDAITGAVVLFSDNQTITEAREKIEQLERMALLDPMTRLGNRRYCETQIQRSLDELSRYAWPFGVLLIAVNDLDTIAEIEGKEMAAQRVRIVSRTLAGNLRSSDVVCRWDQDRFLAVVRNVTRDNLVGIAIKLEQLAAGSAVRSVAGAKALTVSVVATMAQESDTVASLTSRAEALLADDNGD